MGFLGAGHGVQVTSDEVLSAAHMAGTKINNITAVEIPFVPGVSIFMATEFSLQRKRLQNHLYESNVFSV